MEGELDRRALLTGVGAAVAAGTVGAAVVDSGPADAYLRPITRMYIPRIGLAKPVYQGIDSTTLAYGVGHGTWSALPGQNGHCLLFGHRTSHGGPFRYLNYLRPGQKVNAGGHLYTVRYTEIIPASQPGRVFTYNGTTPRVSLVACSRPNGWPTSVNYRIVVRASM
jgi:sortase A